MILSTPFLCGFCFFLQPQAKICSSPLIHPHRAVIGPSKAPRRRYSPLGGLVWLQEAAFVLKNHFFPEFSQNFPFLFGKFFQPDIKAASWVQTKLTGSEYSPVWFPRNLQNSRRGVQGQSISKFSTSVANRDRLQTGFCRVQEDSDFMSCC